MRPFSAIAGSVVLAVLLVAARDANRPRHAAVPGVFASVSDAVDSVRGQVVRSVWDGVYTEEQAARGEAVYAAECQLCHLRNLQGDGVASGLVDRAFTVRWNGRHVGELYGITRSTMPQGAPAILSPQEYVDVIAFLLRANGYPVGDEELIADRAALERVMITEGGR